MDVTATSPSTVSTQTLLTGQKLVIYALIVDVVSYGLNGFNQSQAQDNTQGMLLPMLGLVAGLIGLVMSLVGTYRLITGLGYTTGKKALYLVAMFLPLVNMITLLVLNSRATTALRAAGYKVGLLGVQD